MRDATYRIQSYVQENIVVDEIPRVKERQAGVPSQQLSGVLSVPGVHGSDRVAGKSSLQAYDLPTLF